VSFGLFFILGGDEEKDQLEFINSDEK